jgi:hypothetical protein
VLWLGVGCGGCGWCGGVGVMEWWGVGVGCVVGWLGVVGLVVCLGVGCGGWGVWGWGAVGVGGVGVWGWWSSNILHTILKLSKVSSFTNKFYNLYYYSVGGSARSLRSNHVPHLDVDDFS